ncbi:acetyl esterase/lipase [Sphingomonas sp. BE123]|uniref:alpha/beta hydrolase n=1 Tax=Sphingomonas sp. BE123 TaxID=2817842 RepID=UPI002860CB7C|nr:acetyl esterase/lipase [Sphingomonas sp. BE123]
MIRLALGITGLALVAVPVADAQRFRERLAERMAERAAARGAEAPAAGMVEHSFGTDPLQKLDFWAAKDTARPAPIVIFVHGGGWKRGDKRNATGAAKVTHFLEQGYAVASVNYRLVPAAKVEDQAADVAAAFAWLRSNASKLNIDPARMVLMGHSAGAHLVALVGTDPRYARAAGFALSDISGVIPLDGAAYDVAAQLADGPSIMQDTYGQAFGSDPARQKSLSPTLHAAGPNAPAFLILHVDRDDGKRQSEALGAALRQAGTPAQVTRIEGRGLIGHMEVNRKLGQPDYPATPVVDAWLKTRFQP